MPLSKALSHTFKKALTLLLHSRDKWGLKAALWPAYNHIFNVGQFSPRLAWYSSPENTYETSIISSPPVQGDPSLVWKPIWYQGHWDYITSHSWKKRIGPFMFVLIHVNLSHVLGTAALLFRLCLVDLQHAFLQINLLLCSIKKNLCFSFLLSPK